MLKSITLQGNAPKATLFLSPDQRRPLDKKVSDMLAEGLAVAASGSVSPTREVEQFINELKEMDFARPLEFDKAVQWTIDALSQGMVQMTHPGYLGLFNPKPTYASEVGDRIVAAFNPQSCVWTHAPLPVEIDRHVIAAMAAKIGLPVGAGGHFTSGGSEANNTAFLCALTRTEPRFSEDGAASFSGKPCIYISEESHLAWLKIAHQSGVGRHAISRIPTDGSGRMDTKILRETIQRDLAVGGVPVMIAATAGTTNAGMVDPLFECRSIADEFDLWFHVDAAWAGAAAISQDAARALAGIETADSVTVDAHKWLAATMGTGMFLVRDTSILPEVFNVQTSYMPSNNEALDPYVNSMQWSRRFTGIRLFMTLLMGGWESLEVHINHSRDMIAMLNEELVSLGWTLKNESTLAISCFAPPEGTLSPQEIVAQVVRDGRFWISKAKFEGQDVVRFCVTNNDTGESDLRAFVVLLQSIIGAPLNANAAVK